MVNAELLAAKTRSPRLPAGHVARPRLAAMLLEAARHGVVLVSAPAGFGKTTLIMEALQLLEHGEDPREAMRLLYREEAEYMLADLTEMPRP